MTVLLASLTAVQKMGRPSAGGTFKLERPPGLEKALTFTCSESSRPQGLDMRVRGVCLTLPWTGLHSCA